MINTNLLINSLFDRKFYVNFNVGNWVVNFSEGDLFELNRKLVNAKEKYPIIWLQSGYTERYRRDGRSVTLEGCNFFLITKGDVNDTYLRRYQTNYQGMLIPLFDRFLDTLAKAKGIDVLNGDIPHVKLPFNDVSELTSKDARKRYPQTATVPDIWDAIVINDLNLRINTDCYPMFNV